MQKDRYNDLIFSLSHYNRILNTKPTVKINFQNNNLVSNNYKYKKNLERQRRYTNQLMLQKILKIKGQNNDKLIFSPRRKSLKSQFKQRQKQKQILKANHSMHKRIKVLKPEVGTIQSWNTHYKNFRKKQQLIQQRKAFKTQFNFNQQVFTTFHRFVNTDIKTKFKVKSHHQSLNQDQIKVQVSCQIPHKKYSKKKKSKRMLKTECGTVSIQNDGIQGDLTVLR